MSESEKKQKRVHTYILAEYIIEVEGDFLRLKDKIELLDGRLTEFEEAMQAVTHLRAPLRCLKREFVVVQDQIAKYRTLMAKRRRTIEFLRGLGETVNSVKLYCVTQKSGKINYVKSDHIKLAEAMCSCVSDPAQSVLAVDS